MTVGVSCDRHVLMRHDQPSATEKARLSGFSRALVIASAGLVSLRSRRNQLDLFCDGEHKVRAGFECRLRVALKKVGGYHAGTDEATCEHAYGSAECGTHDHSTAPDASVLDSIALQARAWSDEPFGVHTGVCSWRGCDHSMQLEFAAVFEGDGLGLKKDGAVPAEVTGGEVGDAAVDLSTSGDDYLAILENVGGDAAAERLALFREIAGQLVE